MEENNKVFTLQPLSKWKRILLSLGDYFITFIISFVLFNLAVFPLAKVICNTSAKNNEATVMETKADALLIDNGILLRKEGNSKFEDHVNYTFKCFLSYYAFDEENPSSTYPEYGHKEQNEVIKHYFVTIKSNVDKYLSAFNEANVDGLFTIGNTENSIALKNEYKTLLSNELLEITDESQYSRNMLNFRDHIFARLFYLNVYQGIADNDFVSGDESYLTYMNRVKEINKELGWVASGASIVTVVLGWAISYVLIPLINKERRTITMSIMKLDKLKMNTFYFIDKKNVLMQSFYYLLLAVSSVIVMPMLFFGVAYSFNLPILFPLSVISLLLAVASLIATLLNQYNRSGSDILTFTVIVPTSELDEMYRVKNNGWCISSKTN